jgi:hypothetical protein
VRSPDLFEIALSVVKLGYIGVVRESKEEYGLVVKAGARIQVIGGKGKGGYGHRYSPIVQSMGQVCVGMY